MLARKCELGAVVRSFANPTFLPTGIAAYIIQAPLFDALPAVNGSAVLEAILLRPILSTIWFARATRRFSYTQALL